MKRLVVLCLISIVETVAFAQQPSEWRPNIAEDNRAASMIDTMSFLETSLQNLGVTRLIGLKEEKQCEIEASYAQSRSVIGASFSRDAKVLKVLPSMPAEKAGLQSGDTVTTVNGKDVNTSDELIAMISVVKAGSNVKIGYLRDGKKGKAEIAVVAGTDLSTWLFDLKQIDPLTILVKRYPTGSIVDFRGTNNSVIANVTVRYYPGKDRDQVVSNLPPLTQCTTGEIGCTTSGSLAPGNAFYFRDEDTAKRYARALMHAALLCGGTKAVSPF